MDNKEIMKILLRMEMESKRMAVKMREIYEDYYAGEEYDQEAETLHAAVLNMAKELPTKPESTVQEKEVWISGHIFKTGIKIYFCKCGSRIRNKQKRCLECGQVQDWRT